MSPAAQRQKSATAAAAADPAEETITTTLDVYQEIEGGLEIAESQKAVMYEMYVNRELCDVILTVGDQSLAAHRNCLAMVSKRWRAQFSTAGMAESKSKEVVLEDVSFAALKAIVDFVYTDKLVVSGLTVVAIIRAANLLQVIPAERAAVDYLVDRLDAGNVLDAMALGAHLSAGEIGRELQEKSKAWLHMNFGLMAAEPSYLALPVAEVASLVESDNLASPEEEIFGAVMAWVKEDEAARKVELVKLLPLVRFPMMADAPQLMKAEPLVVALQPLAFELVVETHQSFAALHPVKAAACPRLRPRKGRRLPTLAFTRYSDEHFTSFNCAAFPELGKTGSVRGKETADDQAAVCAGHVMSGGRHAAEFTVGQTELDNNSGATLMVGLARPSIDVSEANAFEGSGFWGVYHHDGSMYHDGCKEAWEGQEGFHAGDVVGLLASISLFSTSTINFDRSKLGTLRLL